MEKYLDVMVAENSEFCERHEEAIGRNTVIEFYCVLKYDYLSKKCNLSLAEKNRAVMDLIGRRPWNIMYEKKVIARLPLKYKLSLFLTNINAWYYYLRLAEMLERK